MIKKVLKFIFEDYHRPTAKLHHIFMVFKKILFNKKTILFSERTMLLKNPPQSMVYLNSLGRLLNLFINFVYILFFNKYFEKGVYLDGGENKTLKKGNDYEPWPSQAAHIFDTHEDILDQDFIIKIQQDYLNSVDLIINDKRFKETNWWKECREEFNKIFFRNDKIDQTILKNFRNNMDTKAEILNDQNFLKKTNIERINKVKSLLLINLYHKLSENVSLTTLRSASDSKVGENLCLNYRGQRLNQRILRYAYYVSQIKSNTDMKIEDKNLILDIGGGYGGLSRMHKNTYINSTCVIIELPELCMLSSYFLKSNFNNKKIGTFEDFKDKEKIGLEDLKSYDFVILTQNFMDKFKDEIFDIIINTTSLGEMTDEMQDYYIKNIERCSKHYFYSVNRKDKRHEKYNSRGFYDFTFNYRWNALVYKFTHTYHIEFLGKKHKGLS